MASEADLVCRARACVEAAHAQGHTALEVDMDVLSAPCPHRRLTCYETLVVAAVAGDAAAVRRALPRLLWARRALWWFWGRPLWTHRWVDAIWNAAHAALVCGHVEVARALAQHVSDPWLLTLALIHGASLEVVAALLSARRGQRLVCDTWGRALVGDDPGPEDDAPGFIDVTMLRTIVRLRRWRLGAWALHSFRTDPVTAAQLRPWWAVDGLGECLLALARAEHAARTVQRVWRRHRARRARVLAAWTLTRGLQSASQPQLPPDVVRSVCDFVTKVTT